MNFSGFKNSFHNTEWRDNTECHWKPPSERNLSSLTLWNTEKLGNQRPVRKWGNFCRWKYLICSFISVLLIKSLRSSRQKVNCVIDSLTPPMSELGSLARTSWVICLSTSEIQEDSFVNYGHIKEMQLVPGVKKMILQP